MAGDDEKENKGGGGNTSSRQPQPQPQQKRGPRQGDSIFIGVIVWLILAIPWGAAFTSWAINTPVACRNEQGNIVPECYTQLVTTYYAWIPFVLAVLCKLLLSFGSRRVRHLLWRMTFANLDRVTNGITIYWVFVRNLGWGPGLRDLVEPWLRLDVVTLVGLILIVVLSWAGEKLDDVFFDAAGAPQSGGQRR